MGAAGGKQHNQAAERTDQGIVNQGGGGYASGTLQISYPYILEKSTIYSTNIAQTACPIGYTGRRKTSCI